MFGCACHLQFQGNGKQGNGKGGGQRTKEEDMGLKSMVILLLFRKNKEKNSQESRKAFLGRRQHSL